MLKKQAVTFLTALLASAAIAPAAQATEYLSINTGQFEVLRDNDYDAWQFGAEYRFEQVMYGIRPIVGGFATTDGSLYGYAGLNWDIALIPNRLFLIPNFAVGAYSDGDDGKDLGGVLEFRSGIELAYQFENQHQLGVALNHLSNASIYDRNPGEESLLVVYSIPVGTIFGR